MNIICLKSKREEVLGLKEISFDDQAQAPSSPKNSGCDKSLGCGVGRDSFFWTI